MRKLFLLISLSFVSISCSVSKTTNDYVFPGKEGKAEYLASYNQTLKLWPVPFVENDVKTSYGLAHVIITGPENGAPVVLFHGTDSSSTMWYPNIEALSATNRVYSIDYPLEAGKSLSTIPAMSHNEMIIFYNEVFKFYNLKNVSLVAASRGGWVATYLAVQEKNVVGKLILLSPAQTFGGVNKLFKTLSALKLKMFPNRKRLDRFFYQFSQHPDNIDEAYKNQFYLANKYGKTKPDLLRMYKFSEKQLTSLKIPVLVMVADHDVINKIDIVDKAKSLIPNVETAIIKDSGHFLSIDQRDEVNKLMVDFLNKKSLLSDKKRSQKDGFSK